MTWATGAIAVALAFAAIYSGAWAVKDYRAVKPTLPQATCKIQRIDSFRAFDVETMGPIDLHVVTDKRRPCVVA
jgi:hypothetical protein